jgi:hypothetical protein
MIQIVRMKTGEDIIGYISNVTESNFVIKNPMLIDVMVDMKSQQQSFVMKSWLPHQLYKDKEVSIWTNDTIFTADANDEFIVYYEMMIKKIEQYITGEQIMDTLDEDDIYQAMDELDNGAPIH